MERLARNGLENRPTEPPAPRDLAALHRPHERRMAEALLDGRMEELPDGERPLYWMWRGAAPSKESDPSTAGLMEKPAALPPPPPAGHRQILVG